MSGEFSDLSTEDRRKLLRLVCSFAWVDHDVDPDERKFILKLIERMDLSELDRRDAIAWLDEQVTAEELAGAVHDVPDAHKRLFVDMARELIKSDNTIADDEAQELALLELLVGD